MGACVWSFSACIAIIITHATHLDRNVHRPVEVNLPQLPLPRWNVGCRQVLLSLLRALRVRRIHIMHRVVLRPLPAICNNTIFRLCQLQILLFLLSNK